MCTGRIARTAPGLEGEIWRRLRCQRAGFLQTGQAIRIAKTRTVAKKTKPPKRFTAAGLVQAMTGIAKYVSNPQIKALLRETDQPLHARE